MRNIDLTLAAAERAAIVRALVHVGGVKDKACKELGIGRSTLYRKLRAHTIVPDEYKKPAVT